MRTLKYNMKIFLTILFIMLLSSCSTTFNNPALSGLPDYQIKQQFSADSLFCKNYAEVYCKKNFVYYGDSVVEKMTTLSNYLSCRNDNYDECMEAKGWEKERQQIKEEASQTEKEQKCKNSLDKCLNTAAKNYSNNWASACKRWAEKVKNGYQSCIERGNSLGISNLPNYCFSVWGKPDSSPNCSLSREQADSIDKTYKEEKEDCYKEYSLCIK